MSQQNDLNAGGGRVVADRLRDAARFAVDALEPRRLLSAAATAVVEDGVLVITGTRRADEINVDYESRGISPWGVELNGVEFRFAEDAFDRIRVNAGRGDDAVTISTSGATVLPTASILGGGGNDTLIGGAGDDTIRGQGGKDSIIGGEGDDLVFGNAGADDLAGGHGDDTVLGGAGNDTLRTFGGAKAGSDRLFGNAGKDRFVGASKRGVRDEAAGEAFVPVPVIDTTPTPMPVLVGGSGSSLTFTNSIGGSQLLVQRVSQPPITEFGSGLATTPTVGGQVNLELDKPVSVMTGSGSIAATTGGWLVLNGGLGGASTGGASLSTSSGVIISGQNLFGGTLTLRNRNPVTIDPVGGTVGNVTVDAGQTGAGQFTIAEPYPWGTPVTSVPGLLYGGGFNLTTATRPTVTPGSQVVIVPGYEGAAEAYFRALGYQVVGGVLVPITITTNVPPPADGGEGEGTPVAAGDGDAGDAGVAPDGDASDEGGVDENEP